MDNLKIKFYQEAEACPWTNRFKTDMTFGQLRKAIYEDKLDKADIKVYSVDLDVHIPSSVFVVDGMNISSIILENGTQIWLRPKTNGIVYDKNFVISGLPDKNLLDNFLEPLTVLVENNATEEEKKKLFDDYNKKYMNP